MSKELSPGLIRDWAFKNELLPYFNNIYGREEGNKQEHIRLVREKFLDPIIFFVSDSSGDMSLPADCCIGVEVPHNDIQKFFDQGAWRVVLGPINFKDIEHIIESYLKSL